MYLTSCRWMIILSLPFGLEPLVLDLTIAKSWSTGLSHDLLTRMTKDAYYCNNGSTDRWLMKGGLAVSGWFEGFMAL